MRRYAAAAEPLSFLTAITLKWPYAACRLREGTQITMRELGWGFVNLDFILITHFHADHVAGLPGLLLSLSNYGRTQEVTPRWPCRAWSGGK